MVTAEEARNLVRTAGLTQEERREILLLINTERTATLAVFEGLHNDEVAHTIRALLNSRRQAGGLMTARQSITQGCPRILHCSSPRRSNSKTQPTYAQTPPAINELKDFTEEMENLRGRLDDTQQCFHNIRTAGYALPFAAAVDESEVRGPLGLVASLVNGVAGSMGLTAELVGGGAYRSMSNIDWVVRMRASSIPNAPNSAARARYNTRSMATRAGPIAAATSPSLTAAAVAASPASSAAAAAASPCSTAAAVAASPSSTAAAVAASPASSAAAAAASASDRVLGDIEVKGPWQLKLQIGEQLWLLGKDEHSRYMQALQQLYGDMVMDEAQWGVLTTINESLIVCRDKHVGNKELFVSEVFGPDQLPLALLCMLEKATASVNVKQRLKRGLVTLTPVEGYQYTLELPAAQQTSTSGRQLRSGTKRTLRVHISAASKRQRQLEADLDATTSTLDGAPQKGNGSSSSSSNNSNDLQPLFPSLVQLDVGDGQLTPAVQASASSIMEVKLLPLGYSKVKLLDVLASSSYGKVYKGSIDGKDLVIKLFDPRFHGSQAAFERELRMYAQSKQLQGDVLCDVVHFGVLDPSGALLIAFSPAGTAIDRSTATNAVVQQGMITALHKLHQQNIIHGDVRLSNFCVADDGCVKIIDLDRAYSCSLPADAGTAAAATAAQKATAAKQAEELELYGLLPKAAATSTAAAPAAAGAAQ